MPRYDDFDYGDPENRKDAVRRNLARIGLSLDTKDKLPGDADDPAVARRKAQDARSRLDRQDARWGTFRGCSLGAEPPEQAPRWAAGDDGAVD